jgi:hypothetical protein
MNIDRRTFIRTATAAVAVPAIPGTVVLTADPTAAAPSLASLLRSYLAECDAINQRCHAIPDDHPDPDGVLAAWLDANNAKLRQAIALPARTADDALAAVNWLQRHGSFDATSYEIDRYEPCLFEKVSWHLIEAARNYIAAQQSEVV